MALWLCWLIGALVAISVYLLLGRQLLQWLFGVIILSSTANLILLISGQLSVANPPLVPTGAQVPVQAVTNPLPQALILTAIVIGFGLLVFALVLLRQVWRAFDSIDSAAIRLAEPPPHHHPHGEDSYP